MIYATCLNEQNIPDNNNFEMDLLTESVEMSLILIDHLPINESVADKFKSVIDKLMEYINTLFSNLQKIAQILIEKVKKIINDAKKCKENKMEGIVVNNFKVLEPTGILDRILVRVKKPNRVFLFISDNVNEKDTENDIVKDFLKNELKCDKTSFDDIDDEDLLKTTVEDLSKGDIMYYIAKNHLNDFLDVFNNINSYRNKAVDEIKIEYDTIIRKYGDSEKTRVAIFKLKTITKIYGTLCNIFMTYTSKYIRNLNMMASFINVTNII